MLHALGNNTKQLHLAISTTSTLHAVHYTIQTKCKTNLKKKEEENKIKTNRKP